MIFSENRFPLFRIMLKGAKNQRGAFYPCRPRLMRFPHIILLLRRKFIDSEHLTGIFIRLPLWPN